MPGSARDVSLLAAAPACVGVAAGDGCGVGVAAGRPAQAAVARMSASARIRITGLDLLDDS
jgi:hypothetical protein